jgi:hypothetical protein
MERTQKVVLGDEVYKVVSYDSVRGDMDGVSNDFTQTKTWTVGELVKNAAIEVWWSGDLDSFVEALCHRPDITDPMWQQAINPDAPFDTLEECEAFLKKYDKVINRVAENIWSHLDGLVEGALQLEQP